MVVYIVDASCHVSLPGRSKHYIFNLGLLDQQRLTEHACSVSSKCLASYSTDTHICSWKLPSATSMSLVLLTSDFLCLALRQTEVVGLKRGSYHCFTYAGQFEDSSK